MFFVWYTSIYEQTGGEGKGAMAKFNVRLAVMDSGKSDTLIKTHYNYVHSKGLAAIATKPAADTKADSRIVSRAGLELETDFLITPDMNVRERIQQADGEIRRQQLANQLGPRAVGLQVVLVDEAQFLDPHQISDLYLTANEDDISVICYGLKADFRTKMFPGTQRMIELADTLETMTTMCRCGSQARFNARKLDDTFIFEGGQVAIDGEQSVTYESLCGTCYLEEGGRDVILGAN